MTHLGMAGNRDLGALPRLVRLIRAGGYDLVHTHLYRACVYGGSPRGSRASGRSSPPNTPWVTRRWRAAR